MTMLHELGAKMHLPDLDPSFPYPADPNRRIHVFLDICHMLKLMRNTLAADWIITSPEGGEITWNYTRVQNLNKLQEEEGLRLGNKLSDTHIKWESQKMKVSLVAQALSSSIVDAIEYCNKDLRLTQFR